MIQDKGIVLFIILNPKIDKYIHWFLDLMQILEK
jgi:hypothetical protein